MLGTEGPVSVHRILLERERSNSVIKPQENLRQETTHPSTCPATAPPPASCWALTGNRPTRVAAEHAAGHSWKRSFSEQPSQLTNNELINCTPLSHIPSSYPQSFIQDRPSAERALHSKLLPKQAEQSLQQLRRRRQPAPELRLSPTHTACTTQPKPSLSTWVSLKEAPATRYS